MDKIREFFKKDRFAAHNDITLLEIRPGYAKAQMIISDKPPILRQPVREYSQPKPERPP